MHLWWLVGWIFLGVGALGVVLPLLPTTPFVLLAAGCFARSSPRAHRWLIQSQLFGPMISQWEAKRCVNCRVKIVALTMMALVGGSSVVFFIPPGWMTFAGIVLILVGCASVLSLNTCQENAADEDQLGRGSSVAGTADKYNTE